jgi:fatty-acyl-CoA synthase
MDLGWITAAPNAALAVGDPDRTAVSLEDRQHVSYADLLSLQNRYANGLIGLGVRSGDRVGVLLHNSVEYVALYFAIARVGAIAVRLNTRLGSSELTFALTDSDTSVLCLDAALLGRVDPIRTTVPVSEYIAFGGDGSSELATTWTRSAGELEESSADEPGRGRPSGSDPVMLMYTSGTTGFPKAAVWTHENALGCAVSQALELGYTPDTVAMTTGPLYHAGAFEALLLPAMLRQGRAIVTRSGGFDIERVVAAAAREGVTDIMLYPFMLYDLLRIDGLDASTFPSLRCIFTGGDPIMTWALREAQTRFPGVEVKQGYGLTESTQSTCLDHADGVRHPDSIGRPFPLKEVSVVDERGVEVPNGETGEIRVRGVGTTSAYWRRPHETAAAYRGGWLHTGDLGHVSDGLLFLSGRKKDMIRSGGENISPAEVEIALTAHPAIADAAVVAVPDPKFLEVGCAVLVIAEGAEVSDEQVLAHCRERLAGYKCPKHVVRVDALPRNASGKVLKAELRERYRSTGRELPRQ